MKNKFFFPYVYLIDALKKSNPGKALAVEMAFLTKSIPVMDLYVVTKKDRTVSARLELM